MHARLFKMEVLPLSSTRVLLAKAKLVGSDCLVI